MGRRNWCSITLEQPSGDLLFDIRVEKAKGHGETVGYKILSHWPILTHPLIGIPYEHLPHGGPPSEAASISVGSLMFFGHISILEPQVAVYIFHLLGARMLCCCIVLPTVLVIRGSQFRTPC
jgi:hypothetical protein